MWKAAAFCLSVTLSVCATSCWADANAALAASRHEVLLRYGIDPSSSIQSRLGDAPANVVKMFADSGMAKPTIHVLTDSERQKFSAALADLPPLHRRILSEHLRSVSFLDGLPNNALTSVVNPADEYKVFDLTIRAGALSETVSQLVTQKEKTCFETAGSPLSVSIEAGSLDAIVYVLLHETTHMVDRSLGLTPVPPTPDSVAATSFTVGIWDTRTKLSRRYDRKILEVIKYRMGGHVLMANQAKTVYFELSKTPFASLYASSNWYDDLAELVAWYHLTQKLSQPYRIEVRNGPNVIYAYEPMKSELVRSRMGQIERLLYADGAS